MKRLHDVDAEHDAVRRASKAAELTIDKRPAINRLFTAWNNLRNEGWRDIMYAPKDGTEIEVIEAGSVGIHRARWHSWACEKSLPGSCGCFFVAEAGDLWPSHPILFREIKERNAAPPGERQREG